MLIFGCRWDRRRNCGKSKVPPSMCTCCKSKPIGPSGIWLAFQAALFSPPGGGAGLSASRSIEL
eukprot:8338501-Karenia_brevis.AAC.1